MPSSSVDEIWIEIFTTFLPSISARIIAMCVWGCDKTIKLPEKDCFDASIKTQCPREVSQSAAVANVYDLIQF